MSSPNVLLSKASKRNLHKKELHIIKKAKVEDPDHLIVEEDPSYNAKTYFMILRNISVILDKKAKSQKLINNRPEYDMKYVNSYILNYYSINDYQQFFEELFETERQYDTLSVIQPNETP
ncbi:19345_t:CDS:2 [Cetraspora pellucida]|uniref:19345_t:CDS:1 n=1 Tax=Cetraspora pellucida TaxID=1433469 RepID=A0A9N8VYM6_9GLOM|nr:19345_t:CDS:2 [Cetraspora pellucida]